MSEPTVSRSPEIMGGTPVFLGIRVPVQTLLDYPARISRHPSTAPAQWHALSGFHSGTVLNVVSATPAHCLVAKTAHAAPLNRLATNGGEKCGLEAGDSINEFLSGFPSVTRQQVIAFLEQATEH